MERFRWNRIVLLPHRVVRRKRVINYSRFGLDGPHVKRQHSHVNYLRGMDLSTGPTALRLPACARAARHFAAISSVSGKKNRDSRVAFSSLSDAWMAFRSF